MNRLALAALLALAAAAGAAGSAQARTTVLTPAEQQWATPLIKIWNLQNAGLQLVVGAASAKNALLVGSKPNNEKLAVILGTLLSCTKPKDAVKAAGSPPTARMAGFGTALHDACAADRAGADAFTKAMVAYTDGDAKLTEQLLSKGVTSFKRGTADLTKAYNAIIALGGKNLFKA